ncbi:hypothetical protein FO440_08660 [Mucilaginibacter corticis]|uniref:Uncharacterized protein n=1 Tax=Mucilaginibacter corticis TaxID=2597670 RepID=A0A556MWC0_9SPHI|nr:hypothetical protein [Mucilaginibacter corticis]TSJ44230.1 hypothetical protein FO440_08660 [Mucilaginibacter corticis]
MTIQVYTFNEEEEKALLDFLNNGHYKYKSAEEDALTDVEFITQYNKELEEAEAQMDAGDFLTHDQTKKHFADRRKRTSGS